MPTLEDLIGKFEATAFKLRGHVETNIILTANDGITILVERLTETGKDSTGNDFKDYTPSYKARKIKKKRYKGFVDFQDTGRMLANLQVIGKSTDFGSVKVSIGNTGEDNIRKMESNTKQRGPILKFSKSEDEELEGDFINRFEDFIDEIFKT